MSCDIVQTYKPYSYRNLQTDLSRLKAKYPFIHIEVIGQSVQGKNIYAIRLGQGDKEIFYSGDWHANEYLTGQLLMKFIEEYSRGLRDNQSVVQNNIRYMFWNYTIWIVPMVNPDGIDIVVEGLEQNNSYYDLILAINQNSLDFRNWTANARGIDLNHQWPAKWEEEVMRSPQIPSPKRYGGESPLSEPETLAIYDFVHHHEFQMVLAFHSQGEEIFWGFEDLEPLESESIVYYFSSLTGYCPKKSATSSAGFKDWFIQEFHKPGFTIEIGWGENPLPITQFNNIYRQNIVLLFKAPTLIKTL